MRKELVLLIALAGCNESRPGANNLVAFTPLNCGISSPVAGCSFDNSLALWGEVDVQITGIDTFSVEGLDLRSGDPSILTVERTEPFGGQPTWKIHGNGEGVADLIAVDGATDVDFTEVPVRAAQRLTLVKVLGEAVGPTDEAGAQSWTVNAEAPVSFQARMLVDQSAELIGRMAYTFTLPPGSRLLDSEVLPGSHRDQGYLYVEPPAGVYPFSVELAVAPTVKVDAVIKAQ